MRLLYKITPKCSKIAVSLMSVTYFTRCENAEETAKTLDSDFYG